MKLFRDLARLFKSIKSLESIDAIDIRMRITGLMKVHHRSITTGLFFGVLLIPLSSSVNLTGQLGFLHRKISVDTLDGGIIEEVMVVDGQFVKQGEILARLIEPRLDAEMTSLMNSSAARLCKLTRYEQLLSGSTFKVPLGFDLIQEKYLNAYCPDEEKVGSGLLLNFNRRLAVLDRQIAQAKSDISLLENSLSDEKRRVAIQSHLYKKRQELVDQSFYSEAALLEQESLLIGAKQGQASKSLDVSERRNRLLDLMRQKSDIQSEFYERYRAEYAGIRAEFESQYASLKASVRSNKFLTLVAPQSGYVNKLKKARPGLLLSARETLMEIVPSAEDLVVVATYRPTDHVNVLVGQEASVRLLTHNQSTAPEFKGKIISTSPDVKQDSPLDTPSYEAVISFSCDSDCRVANQLTAGVPVDVYVLGAKRSLLSYLINSLYRVGTTAVSEPN